MTPVDKEISGNAVTEHFETACSKKGRGRGMAQRSLDLIEAMYGIAEAAQPITGRGVGYKLFTAGLIPSMARSEMQRVYRLLKEARERGDIPWEWIVDETRTIDQGAVLEAVISILPPRLFLFGFDLIELNGDDLRRDPLEVRKATLASVLAKTAPGIQLNEHIEADGPTVFAHACKMGLEGIVSKRRTSPYRSGRSPDWLKSKNPACEAVRRLYQQGRDRQKNNMRIHRTFRIPSASVPRLHQWQLRRKQSLQ
jgi:hypothetical protein